MAVMAISLNGLIRRMAPRADGPVYLPEEGLWVFWRVQMIKTEKWREESSSYNILLVIDGLLDRVEACDELWVMRDDITSKQPQGMSPSLDPVVNINHQWYSEQQMRTRNPDLHLMEDRLSCRKRLNILTSLQNDLKTVCVRSGMCDPLFHEMSVHLDAVPACSWQRSVEFPVERGMASLDLPYRCPRCGEHKRFRSLSSLRAHLEYNHTYETLYVLSKSNSVCDAAALLPLVADGALAAESRFPYRELPCSGEELGLAPTSTTCYLPNVEFPLGEFFVKTAMSSSDALSSTGNNAVAVAANVAASAVEAAYEEGLARLKARAFERLELDERLEKLSEEVEQKISARVSRLQAELERKSSELEKAKLESERLSQEKQDLEDKATELSRQVDVSVEMLAGLKQDLENKEQELSHKQQEVAQIDQFLQETASREANAKLRLQQFIEELLDRADRAEKQLQIISNCGTTPNGSLGHCSVGSKSNGRQRNSSISGVSRGMYQVSDRRSSPSTAASVQGKSMSQGSGGYDSDSVDLHALEDCPDAQYYHVQCRLGEPGGGYERAVASRNWGLRKQAIQNWQRRPYRNSMEGDDGDVSDGGSRTTESEAEMWEQDRRAGHRPKRNHLVWVGVYAYTTGLLPASDTIQWNHCGQID
ncbi:hypothetical protein DNTS_020835 [Danionella cerebrum]|uniref:FBX41/ZN365 C2H2-type zinc finger domain-containing protein n=1 Tax=Danionella cerebrum TaxID=2873325 RepID=A0A553RBI4_9TELE|nr:hypothetical protein DNTS_020835 [Danionella translucida]